MGKTKVNTSKNQKNPHLRARVAFLHRASLLIAQTTCPSKHTKSQILETSDRSQHEHTKELSLEQDAVHSSTSPATFQGPPLAPSAPEPPSLVSPPLKNSISLRLVSDLKSVAQRSQIRLSPDVKHSLCKRCNAPLIQGKTSRTRIENHSKNASKPWAEYNVIECLLCSAVKRFPTKAPRQAKKSTRQQKT